MPSVELRTVADVIGKYLAHADSIGLWSAEAKSFRIGLFAKFVAALGTMPIDETKSFHLREWIDGQKGMKSSSSRRGAATAIKAAFRWAHEQEYIERHPFRAVQYPESDPRPAMPDDVLEEICVCASKRFERAVRFLALTGCRVSELCELKWHSVDLVKGFAIIEKHKSFRFTRKAKVLPLVPDAVALLTEIRKRQPDSYAGVVFQNNFGRPWNRTSLAHQLKRMKDRGEIDTNCTLHGLRHRLAAKCIAAGAPLALVSASLGHASTSFTAARYGHVGEAIDAMRAAMNKANEKAG
jgi:integrase